MDEITTMRSRYIYYDGGHIDPRDRSRVLDGCRRNRQRRESQINYYFFLKILLLKHFLQTHTQPALFQTIKRSKMRPTRIQNEKLNTK